MRYYAVHVALQQVCKPFKVLIPGFPACTNCLIDEDLHSSLSCCLICLLYHLFDQIHCQQQAVLFQQLPISFLYARLLNCLRFLE